MTHTLLLLIVPPLMVLAIGIDLAAAIGWVRGRWR